MKIKRIGNIEFIWSELNNQYEIIRHYENGNIVIAFIDYKPKKNVFVFPELRMVVDRPFDYRVNWQDFGVLAKFALDYVILMGTIDSYIADKELHDARY